MAWIERFGGSAYRTQKGDWAPYKAGNRKINDKTIVALVGRGFLNWIQFSMVRAHDGYYQIPTVCGVKGKKLEAINLVDFNTLKKPVLKAK